MENGQRLVLTPREAAQELHISMPLCYSLIRERRIPAVRISDRRLAIPRKALEEFLQAKLTQPV